MSCIVVGCKSHSSRKENDAKIISFHRFPSDVDMRQKLINAIARNNWEWKKQHRICSKHFSDDCFNNIGHKWRRLKIAAVPSLHLRKEEFMSTEVRSLSTSASVSQLIKPPVQVFGLEGRYAAALYSAATKNKTLDVVEKELSHFQSKMKSDAKLKEFIINPSLKRSLKSDALKHLTTETKMCPTTSNLLVLLADNGRLGKLENVINAYKIMMAAHRGEVTCEVITAKPLDQAQRQNLEAALKKFLKANEILQLTAKVDPTLIGGMVVSISDKYVDMSVASKVKKYTELISAAV